MWDLLQDATCWKGWAFGAIATIFGGFLRGGIKILVNARLRSKGTGVLND
jgi:hypothetical protein